MSKYLEQAMKDSSKGHWVHGFEKHPDPDLEHCTPCKGIDGVQDKDNLAYVSIGDHIVKPWYQENIRLGNIPPENEKHSYYMSRIVPSHLPAHSLTEQGCQPKFMGGNHFHYNGKRIYTPKEMVRLMSLPNDYQMTGDYNDKGARIGLMVAPLCLYYLVEEIKKQILEPWNSLQQVDHGQKETFDKWNGKFLDETSYDTVVHSRGSGSDIIKVYKPHASLGERPLLAVKKVI